MALDPNIILGVKPISLPQNDPLEQYGKSLTLQTLMRQGDEADRSIKRKDALNALLAGGADEEGLRRGGFLEESLKVGKESRERAKLEAERQNLLASAGKSEYETQIGQIQHGSSILSTAKDQPSWDMARRVMAITFPKIASQLPEQYDPAFVQAKLAAGQTLAQKLSDERSAQTNAETGRHNAATEKNAAGQLTETNRHNIFTEQNPGLQHIEGPDGILAFNTRTGAATPVMGADGKPVQGGKALTESQGKATGMALRAQTADDTLLSLEKKGVTRPGNIKGIAEGLGRSVPLVGEELGKGMGAATNFTQSPEQQRVEQAQRDFVNAVLRVESGASISQSEFDNARRQYFPQIGDSEATIKQKRDNRQTAIQALKVQAGPGSKSVVSKPQDDKPTADPAKMSDDDLKKALGIP